MTHVRVRTPVQEAETYSLSPHVYRVLRSFVESSSKTEYEWNRAYAVATQVYVFRKPGRWVLRIWGGKRESGDVIAVLEDFKGREVFVLTAVGDKLKLVVENHEVPLSVELIPERLVFFTTDSSKVPFVRPISADEITERLRHYITVEP